MLPSFCNDVVEVSRAPLADSRGSGVRDWESATSRSVAGCSVQPQATSRDFSGRALQVADQWTLYAPAGSDIRAGDRVSFGGRVFEVDGAPYEWKSPTGRASSMQCRLAEWRG